jgi:hypothetical protein
MAGLSSCGSRPEWEADLGEAVLVLLHGERVGLSAADRRRVADGILVGVVREVVLDVVSASLAGCEPSDDQMCWAGRVVDALAMS